MYGFLLRPKWIAFHLLVFGAVALMIGLGFWQLRRLDERQAFNAVVAERAEQPPTPLAGLLDTTGDTSELEWRQVTVAGTWSPEQVIWYNRSQDGLAGDNVLTPLVGDDGTTVIVNRGFVPIGTQIPEPTSGPVEVLGRVREPHVPIDASGGADEDPADDAVTEVRRVDLGVLAAQVDGEVAPVYLDLVASIPEVTEADPRPTPAPEQNDGPHLSYAMQWFIFGACVAVGWVLAVRRSIGTRRRSDAVAPEPVAVP